MNFLFADGPIPSCNEACDVNGDGLLDVSDVVFTVQFIFGGGNPPPPPYPGCAADPEADCAVFGACPP